jgi:RNA polymerase sigma-70 factor (ECF subfamily)
MLRTIEGLDTSETAQVLGVSEAVVRQRLHRAREMVQDDVRHRIDHTVHAAFGFLGRRCDRVVANVLRRLAAAFVGDGDNEHFSLQQ